jgi:hypothetical protein
MWIVKTEEDIEEFENMDGVNEFLKEYIADGGNRDNLTVYEVTNKCSVDFSIALKPIDGKS